MTGWWSASLVLAMVTGGTPPDTVALVDVRVTNVLAGTLEPDQTVLVADGRILSRGHVDSVTVEPWVERLSLGGRTVVPGLVDAHAHVDSLGLGLFLANGVTAVRELNGADRHLRYRDRVAAGDLPGPRLLVASELLTGSEFPNVRYRLIDGVEAANAVAADIVEAGYDFFKIYDGLSSAEYRTLVERARDAGIPLTGHIPAEVGLDAVLAAKQGLEHAEKVVVEVGGHGPVDPAAIQVVVARIARSGVPFTATLAVQEVLTAGDSSLVRLRDADELVYVSAGTREWWASVSGREPPPPGTETRGTRFLAAMRALTLGLVRAGAPVLVGTDTPNPLMIPGFSVHEEMGALVRAGLSAREALAAGTVTPGEVLPFAIPTGRIEPGYAADLVVVEGDPLADLDVLRRPFAVMARGCWYDRARLDAFLEAALRP